MMVYAITMELTKELITRFLENKCTKEEADFLCQQLMEDPRLFDDYLGEEEWENFRFIQSLPRERSEAWFTRIRQQKGKGDFSLCPK